jgi:hypothetical protein
VELGRVPFVLRRVPGSLYPACLTNEFVALDGMRIGRPSEEPAECPPNFLLSTETPISRGSGCDRNSRSEMLASNRLSA